MEDVIHILQCKCAACSPAAMNHIIKFLSNMPSPDSLICISFPVCKIQHELLFYFWKRDTAMNCISNELYTAMNKNCVFADLLAVDGIR